MPKFYIFLLFVFLLPIVSADEHAPCFQKTITNYCIELSKESKEENRAAFHQCIECGYSFSESWLQCMMLHNHPWISISDEGISLKHNYQKCLNQINKSFIFYLFIFTTILFIVPYFYQKIDKKKTK
jgi:hypothetical protein